MGRFTVVIVGSGFAGSILARALNRQGHRVFLCERTTHPRFALGESSTPLAALCLERLARRYDLPDLACLAAYGRWLEHMPGLRRGLKRGFTFYLHRPGEPFSNGPSNEHRLLVAASRSDAVADSHWLREDVDAFLVERAVAEGVEYLDHLELDRCDRRTGGFCLRGRRLGRALRLEADFVVDGSGAGGFLASRLGIPSRNRTPLRTDLLYGHFEAVESFPQVAAARGAEFPSGPYPDEQAAVHHLLEEGWMYVLPFDHGVVSAGFVLDRSGDPAWVGALDTLAPEEAWYRLLRKYPTLLDQFAEARPVRPIERIRGLQRRLLRPAGEGWTLLPHTYCFLSPLFSTGIAWSLLAVERLALMLEAAAKEGTRSLDTTAYGAILDAEANHLGRLIPGAYRVRRDFDVFVEYTFLYFAAVSYAEAAQRLLPEPIGRETWAWQTFLGADDPVLREALRWALAAIEDRSGLPASSGKREGFAAGMRRAIAARNVAGLADPPRNRLYPVDLDALVAGADKLGLSPESIRADLSSLRGDFEMVSPDPSDPSGMGSYTLEREVPRRS
ncbi:MAG: NAD(P)/FAD-dependent oxidoreductase [Gemmatimonadota bacterium]